MEATLGHILRCGEVNLRVMQLLDRGHTSRFGHPVPTQVRLTPVAGKAILVSGHDMQVSRAGGRPVSISAVLLLRPAAVAACCRLCR